MDAKCESVAPLASESARRLGRTVPSAAPGSFLLRMKETHGNGADLPSLNALRAFGEAVRTGSVSQAARELCVTQGAVSHQIALLEAWFGRPLLVRDVRGVRPTEEGGLLAQTAQDAFARLQDACGRLRADGRGVLDLGASASILSQWVVPRLEGLERALPGIRVRLSTGGSLEDLRRRRLDALVVCGPAPWPPDLEVSVLGSERIGPVCVPGSRRVGVRALLSRPRLVCASRGLAWEEWASASGRRLPKSLERRFDHFAPMLEAAKAGLGVAVVPELLVRSELAAGRLAAPLGFVDGPCEFVVARLALRGREGALRAMGRWCRRQDGPDEAG
jgi:DNA-binding transcriptional LysR family regulator